MTKTQVNIINSFGPQLEAVHRGVISYMCDLWNGGDREYIRKFVNAVDRSEGNTKFEWIEYDILTYKHEYNHVDLAIFGQNANSKPEPFILIELKVHSAEGWNNREWNWQTPVYAEKNQDFPNKLFVTLGWPAIYKDPQSSDFIKVGFLEILEAFGSGEQQNQLIGDWLDALGQMKDLMFYSTNGQRDDISSFNELNSPYSDDTVNWNRFLMADLARELSCINKKQNILANKRDRKNYIGPFYWQIHVSGQDTILHFQDHWMKDESEEREDHDLYMEINQNGKLNFKMSTYRNNPDKQKFFLLRESFLLLFPEAVDRQSIRFKHNSKSRTLLSFEVGLSWGENGKRLPLHYTSTKTDTVNAALRLLSTFHSLKVEGKLIEVLRLVE